MGRGEDEGHGPGKRTHGKIPALARMDGRYGRRGATSTHAAQVARGRDGRDGLDTGERGRRRHCDGESVRPRQRNQKRVAAERQDCAGDQEGPAEQRVHPIVCAVGRFSEGRGTGRRDRGDRRTGGRKILLDELYAYGKSWVSPRTSHSRSYREATYH